MTQSTIYELEVRPNIPDELSGLIELANNLQYSWDRNIRGLFYRLDLKLWDSCDHKPKVFLRRIAQETLDAAVKDNVFMEEYHRVMSAYQSYQQKSTLKEVDDYLDAETDLIAYFCAEFGLHESFPIYSGGLGILAGDHCKAVSDLGVPFVSIGMLYRQGYFTQRIDACGNQIAIYQTNNVDELPVSEVLDEDGKPVMVPVEMPGRVVQLKAWQSRAGHTRMYLLDSNVEGNTEADRQITFQLYGGDRTMRLQQEIVLGIGGVRLLRALGLKPTVYHINEGHAAFLIVERCRLLVEQGMSFLSALEQVAANNVYTTHTPVPAGHDIFSHELMHEYFGECCKQMGVKMEELLSLGAYPEAQDHFNMTALALRGSRFHNGVSRIHGSVASEMEGYVWPQISAKENPISYVTNGVHVKTFLAREWMILFDMRLRDWRNQLLNPDYWSCLDNIPDHRFWSLRKELKSQMLENIYRLTVRRYKKNQANDALIHRMTQYISTWDSDVLVLGFARRFATYKRALLLFTDLERMARLLNDPEKPVMLVFAGKAHPKDEPGQSLIRRIHEISQMPQFQGRVILLEDYNMAMARNLVTGVDVWVNTPEYPLEASGTSGEKAGINGVLNLSVLDGWWGEAYDGKNGWGVTPHGVDVDPQIRDREEASDLLDILEHEVIPTYYSRSAQGYSKGWVELSKNSMKTCIPHFNASRMVMDYVKHYYAPASRHGKLMQASGASLADELAKWKRKIHEQWHNVSMKRRDSGKTWIKSDESLRIELEVYLNGLSEQDVAVECVVGQLDQHAETLDDMQYYAFEYQGKTADEHLFCLDLKPAEAGMNHYIIRMYPNHRLLAHRFETGYQITL